MWVGLILLSFIPWYLGIYMVVNYDQSNKYLQEKSIWWIIEIWKFAMSGKKFNVKNVMKEVETNLKNDLKDKAVKDALDSLSWWTLQN